MNLNQLALLGEAIGGIAVVLTLLYLAHETCRNNEFLSAAATSDAYLKWTEINDLISSDEHLAELWVRVYDNCPLDFCYLLCIRTRRIPARTNAVGLLKVPDDARNYDSYTGTLD